MNKDRRPFWWAISLLVVCGIAILVGYYVGMDKGAEEEKVLIRETTPKVDISPKIKEVPLVKKEISIEKEAVLKKEIKEPIPPVEQVDPCTQIENQVREFFNYLDKKDYIQKLGKGISTFDRFKRIIKKISSRPPVPAGEGLSAEVMTRNIFYFFRILKRDEIQLIKKILRNEADTLEMNLELFYRWLTIGDLCPDHEGIRPSQDVLYHYAGFFLNTIGGRAYLFRRPSDLRLLISHYCILIIHDSDKRGKNRYGIDILPDISPLVKEISTHPDIRFQGEYAKELKRLQGYYISKR